MIVSTADDLTRVLQAHLSAQGTPLAATLTAFREPLARQSESADSASGWFIRRLWELHDRNEDPDNSGLPRCLEHVGSTDRSRSYLLFCPATGFGVVALANSGEGPDPVLWWHFRSGLVHAALGTQPLDATRPLLTRVAPTLLVGLPLLQLAALVAQLFAIRASRRRAGIGAAAALLLGAAAACFGYVLAPAQAAGLPLHQLWSAAPDLGVSTVLSTLLLVCSGAVALHGFHVARPASRRQRPSG